MIDKKKWGMGNAIKPKKAGSNSKSKYISITQNTSGTYLYIFIGV